MVTITRIDLRKCKFTYTENREMRIIDEIFKTFIDGAYFSTLYQEIDEFGKRKWDGFYRFYDKHDKFDFGLLGELKNHLKKSKVEYIYQDNYKKGVQIENLNISSKMRGYQAESLIELFKRNIGIIVVPTRGGKTIITSEAIRIFNENLENQLTLIIVDTVDLFNQTRKEVAQYLEIPENEVGTINDKGLNVKQINIGMVQTLVNKVYPSKPQKFKTVNKKKVKVTPEELREKMSKKRAEKRKAEKFLSEVGFLVIDEIHEQTSTKRINLFKKCKNLKLQLGLSATPYKQQDVISAMKAKGFFGDECYRVKKKRLQKEGFLAIDKVVLISHDVDISSGETYHETLTSQIHENNKRNSIIFSIINMSLKNRWKTLILFNSKKHGRLISAQSKQRFICGDDSTEIRNIERERFLKGKGKILMASNIYKKGITLPEVEVVMIADGGLEGTNVTQKLGRVLGATETKKHCIIIDILDIGSEHFSEHSLNRLEVYDSEVGKKQIEVYEQFELKEIEYTIKDWLHVNK